MEESEKYSEIKSESSGKPNIVNESLNDDSEYDSESEKKAFDYKMTKSLSDLDDDDDKKPSEKGEEESEVESNYEDDDFEDEKQLGI